jgi:hypothetical protein
MQKRRAFHDPGSLTCLGGQQQQQQAGMDAAEVPALVL